MKRLIGEINWKQQRKLNEIFQHIHKDNIQKCMLDRKKSFVLLTFFIWEKKKKERSELSFSLVCVSAYKQLTYNKEILGNCLHGLSLNAHAKKVEPFVLITDYFEISGIDRKRNVEINIDVWPMMYATGWHFDNTCMPMSVCLTHQKQLVIIHFLILFLYWRKKWQNTKVITSLPLVTCRNLCMVYKNTSQSFSSVLL